MALQHSLSLPSGIELQAAYTRISEIRHMHGETVVSVQTWASAAARQSDLAPVASQAYSIPWADEVSLTSAYTALKQEAPFTNALDV
jgi:hypothetical protein